MAWSKAYAVRIHAYLVSFLGLVVFHPIIALAVPYVAPQHYNPPKRGLPGRIEGGGTRGEQCFQVPERLVPLIPETGLGLTVSAHPKFFWYIPKTAAQSAEFFLLDEDDKPLYKTTIKLTNNSGIMSLSFPGNSTLPALVIGKNYYWQLSLICNPQEPSENPFVEGLIQRVTPSSTLVNQLKKATPRDAITLYATAGLWQDALTTLATVRTSRPNDAALMAEWIEFLNSVKLDKIANEPLVQCCTSH